MLEAARVRNGTVRLIKNEDLTEIRKWITKGKLKISVSHLDIALAYQPAGFYGCIASKKLVGCMLGTKIDDAHGFVGLIVIKPGYEDKGVEKKILKTLQPLLEGANLNINIGVDSPSFLKEMYLKRGFDINTHKIQHFEGKPDLRQLSVNYLNVKFSEPATCLERYSDIAQYDQEIHSWNRTEYWRLLGMHPEIKCVAARDGNKVVGIGCIVPQQNRYRIMPLYADNDDIASSIFKRLCLSVLDGGVDDEDLYVFIDYPNVPDNPRPFFDNQHGMRKQRIEETRIYTKEDINVHWTKVYSLSTHGLFFV